MQQHQIPQNVTKYEFGLIGGITIKQFIEVASGVVVALIIQYVFTFLPSYIRTPTAITIALAGAALTFIKYEERTLDTWFVNFIKSIYAPTQYIWQKKKLIPAFFTFQRSNFRVTKARSIPKQNPHLQKYVNLSQNHQLELSQDQKKNLSDIQQMFADTKTPAPSVGAPTPTPQPTASQPIPQPQSATPQSTPLPQPTPKPPSPPQPKPRPQTIVKAPSLAPALKVKSIYKDKKPKAIQPEFASDIEVPIIPQSPNIITGLTVDNREKLISSVVVEIADQHNLPVRAVKSNQLSQFFIASPLKNGKYTIKAQHPNFNFDKIDIEAKGEIIPPIKIVGSPKQ